MVRALLEKTQATPAVTVRSFACSTDLVTDGARVIGCRFIDESGAETRVLAHGTLLATGGAGQVFRETTNPLVATGDGVAMARRAGAAVIDMEFVQFHPTALAVTGAPRFLVSEAVRGEGAHLTNVRGERFTDELAPRDQVARAIFREARATGGPVTLDLRHLDPERVRSRFPRIAATCQRFGLDITRDPIPVTPAAHYVMGGVATDLCGRSTLAGLYAAGEVAGTGVHGANRLASNSLLEGLVFGARAAAAMVGDDLPVPADVDDARRAAASTPRASRDEVREKTWTWLGLERDAAGLRQLLSFLDSCRGADAAPADRAAAELRNLVDVAGAMAASALFREESRGGHCRTDFPDTDDRRFHGHTRLDPAGAQLIDVDPVLETARSC
jgi:L-aspartate oxidase